MCVDFFIFSFFLLLIFLMFSLFVWATDLVVRFSGTTFFSAGKVDECNTGPSSKCGCAYSTDW